MYLDLTIPIPAESELKVIGQVFPLGGELLNSHLLINAVSSITQVEVEGIESCIVIGRIDMTKQNWGKNFVPDEKCAR